MRTRHRPLFPKGTRRGVLYTGSIGLRPPYGFLANTSTANWDYPRLNGSQITVSESHPAWKKRKSNTRFSGDIGGDFFTQKRYVEGPYASDYKVAGSKTVDVNGVPDHMNFFSYSGAMMPIDPAFMSFPAFPVTSLGNLDALGSTAIARVKPTNSVAELSTFLGETLRDGLPKLIGNSFWKDKTLTAKKVGNEYLNEKFGWEPMMRDMRDIASAIYHATEVIRQYERDSGRVVRRRYSFPPISSETSSLIRDGTNAYAIGPIYSDMTNSVIRNQGKVYLKQTVEIRRWFSGAFTYYLPPSGTIAGDAARAKKLLGTGLDPETVWNLTPWSWATDWFANTGDVISNLSDFAISGLVLKYGYVMEHSIARNTYVYSGPTGYAGSTVPPIVSLVSETKIRKRATPFGFGLNWADFSPTQLSIAAALGLSRTKQ